MQQSIYTKILYTLYNWKVLISVTFVYYIESYPLLLLIFNFYWIFGILCFYPWKLCPLTITFLFIFLLTIIVFYMLYFNSNRIHVLFSLLLKEKNMSMLTLYKQSSPNKITDPFFCFFNSLFACSLSIYNNLLELCWNCSEHCYILFLWRWRLYLDL